MGTSMEGSLHSGPVGQDLQALLGYIPPRARQGPGAARERARGSSAEGNGGAEGRAAGGGTEAVRTRRLRRGLGEPDRAGRGRRAGDLLLLLRLEGGRAGRAGGGTRPGGGGAPGRGGGRPGRGPAAHAPGDDPHRARLRRPAGARAGRHPRRRRPHQALLRHPSHPGAHLRGRPGTRARGEGLPPGPARICWQRSSSSRRTRSSTATSWAGPIRSTPAAGARWRG